MITILLIPIVVVLSFAAAYGYTKFQQRRIHSAIMRALTPDESVLLKIRFSRVWPQSFALFFTSNGTCVITGRRFIWSEGPHIGHVQIHDLDLPRIRAVTLNKTADLISVLIDAGEQRIALVPGTPFFRFAWRSRSKSETFAATLNDARSAYAEVQR